MWVAQGHNSMLPVKLEPTTSLSRVTELPSYLLSTCIGRAHPAINHCIHLLQIMQSGYKYESLALASRWFKNYIFAKKI